MPSWLATAQARHLFHASGFTSHGKVNQGKGVPSDAALHKREMVRAPLAKKAVLAHRK